MRDSLHKISAALAVALIAVTQTASADSTHPSDVVTGGSYPHPVVDASNRSSSSYGCQPQTCGWQSDNCCGSWYASGEALFWKAHEEGLAYAAFQSILPTPVTSDAISYDIENPHFKWDTGVRLGLGYTFGCDCWDLAAYWTNFRTTSKGHVELSSPANENETLFPIWGAVQLNSPNAIASKWKLNFNLADFELARRFCVASCVSLKPFLGIRAAWIDQKYQIASELSTPSGNTFVNEVSRIRLKSEFEGVGLLAGLESEWDVGCGFSLYGSAAGSILYGRSHSREEQDLFLPPHTSGNPTSTGAAVEDFLSDTRHGCRYAVDGALGLRWKRCLCGTMALTVQLAWEQHIFFNQNQFENMPGSKYPIASENLLVPTFVYRNSDSQSKRGDLCLQGIVLGARLDF